MQDPFGQFLSNKQRLVSGGGGRRRNAERRKRNIGLTDADLEDMMDLGLQE